MPVQDVNFIEIAEMTEGMSGRYFINSFNSIKEMK